MANGNSVDGEFVSQRAEELARLAERQAGEQAVRQIVDRHFDHVLALRAALPLDNEHLLSRTVESNVDLSNEVAREVSRLHAKMRIIIESVAGAIEAQGYKSKEDALDAMRLGYNERARAGSLLEADRKRVVSCRSLNVAVGVMSDLNKMVMEDIKKTDNTRTERDLLFLNALLVYEVNDFVVNFVEGFEVDVGGEIARLHLEAKQRLAQIRQELDQLTRQASSPDISDSARNATLAELESRRRAVDQVEKEWDRYASQSDALRQELQTISGRLPTLRLIRDSAKNQLNVLEAVTVVRIVGSSLGALSEALKASEELHIIPLNEDRIQRLTGIY